MVSEPEREEPEPTELEPETAEVGEAGLGEPKGKKKSGKVEQIKEALLAGVTEEALIAKGFNKTTVRMAAFELEKQGLRARPGKGKAGDLQVFAKGSPPEALINAIMVPDGDRATFESGMKFGMGIVVLGVRVAQELSAIGVQQAKPLVEMARDMRSGEAMAAKTAAAEAAFAAANQIGGTFAPILNKIADQQQPMSANPFIDMMASTMKPIFQNLVSRFVPGAQQPQVPEGWVKRQE